MAELDYAFLANYATVESGKLTAVGASWTFMGVPAFPQAARMAVAGRVRGRMDEPPIDLTVELVGPEDGFRIAATGQLAPAATTRPYGDGMVGHLFAVDMAVLLPQAGLYEVFVTINGEQARRLAFEASVVQPEP
ncbi:MAG: hypothetical protein WB797_02365 [Nocardioides sp.]